MSWWSEKARYLQRDVRDAESIQEGYSEEATSRSIVHTRQDVILMVSLLDTANNLLFTVIIALFLLVGLVAACAAKLFGYL